MDNKEMGRAAELTEDEQIALLCKVEDYMRITDQLSQTHPGSVKLENELYALVGGMIGKRAFDLDAYESLCQDKDATIAALNQQLAAARNEALEDAAKTCDLSASWSKGESEDGLHLEATRKMFRVQQFQAEACAAAIRALASHPAAPVQPEQQALIDVRNICGIERYSDQSVNVKFMSARAASQFNQELSRVWGAKSHGKPAAPVQPVMVEPDWSGSKTLESEMWKNPLFPMAERLQIADGAVSFRNDVITNLRAQLAAPVQPTEQTEVQKLTQRLQWMGVSNFGFTPGDKATPEDVAKVISLALNHLELSEPAAPPVQRPGDVRETKVLAWRTEDGRVVSSETMDGAKRDGGATLSSLRNYNIPLVSAIATTRPATLTPAQMWDIAESKLTTIDLDTGPEALVIRSEDELYQVVRTILAASGGAHAVPVAWAVMSKNREGIHKLCIRRESAERKAAAWLVEWPNNPVVIRPLVFGDAAPTQDQGEGK